MCFMDSAVDLPAARDFVATHGRLLDRRRLAWMTGEDTAAGVLTALDAYRNPDGGYGWGLEPDLRAAESQPTAAMHAFEVLAELGEPGAERGFEICDWLAARTLPEGGLPFAHPVAHRAGCAPWWLDPAEGTSSLQMTAQVAANAHRLGRQVPAVRAHPWLGRATAWCLETIAGLDEAPFAIELLFAVHVLDAAADVEPEAAHLLGALGRFLPADGVLPVPGGIEGEALRPLDFAPRPDGAAAGLFPAGLLERERRRLAAEQQDDGGWTVSFASSSPMGALEWRAYATVEALLRLGVVSPAAPRGAW
jgi:hypothetical protein